MMITNVFDILSIQDGKEHGNQNQTVNSQLINRRSSLEVHKRYDQTSK